jgi:hypothetical protein
MTYQKFKSIGPIPTEKFDKSALFRLHTITISTEGVFMEAAQITCEQGTDRTFHAEHNGKNCISIRKLQLTI